MPRYKLTLEYTGTRYSGWQVQKNARTVQGELHRAIAVVVDGPPLELYGSGGPTPASMPWARSPTWSSWRRCRRTSSG